MFEPTSARWTHSLIEILMPDLRILLLRLLLDLLNRHVADDNRPSHPELDRSSCFHGSILSLEMIEHFEARCTLDVIKCREVLSFSTVLARPALEQSLVKLKGFWKICELLLVFTQQVSVYSCIRLRSSICCRHFWWHYHGFQVIKRYGFLRTRRFFWKFPMPILYTSPLLLRRHRGD